MSNTGSFVTGHKYRIHWGQIGIDFEKMRVELDEHWMENDKTIYFVHNFTDVRAAIDVTLDGVKIENNTLPADPKDYMTGQNIVQNITDLNSVQEQLFKFVVNGKNSVPFKIRVMNFVAHRCVGACNV